MEKSFAPHVCPDRLFLKLCWRLNGKWVSHKSLGFLSAVVTCEGFAQCSEFQPCKLTVPRSAAGSVFGTQSQDTFSLCGYWQPGHNVPCVFGANHPRGLALKWSHFCAGGFPGAWHWKGSSGVLPLLWLFRKAHRVTNLLSMSPFLMVSDIFFWGSCSVVHTSLEHKTFFPQCPYWGSGPTHPAITFLWTFSLRCSGDTCLAGIENAKISEGLATSW